MDSEGGVVEKFAKVADYFESDESHDLMVYRISEEYESAMAYELNARLIIFEEDNSLLDQFAVDHIREVATLFSKGFINEIEITAGHTEDFTDEAIAAHRINTIYQLFKDFGVDDESIRADMKIYQSDLPNQFVTITMEK